jgi:hypothetical protein
MSTAVLRHPRQLSLDALLKVLYASDDEPTPVLNELFTSAAAVDGLSRELHQDLVDFLTEQVLHIHPVAGANAQSYGTGDPKSRGLDTRATCPIRASHSPSEEPLREQSLRAEVISTFRSRDDPSPSLRTSVAVDSFRWPLRGSQDIRCTLTAGERWRGQEGISFVRIYQDQKTKTYILEGAS